MPNGSRLSLFFVLVVLSACGLLGVVFAQKTDAGASTDSVADVSTSLRSFTEVYRVIEQNYAEPVNADKAITLLAERAKAPCGAFATCRENSA